MPGSGVAPIRIRDDAIWILGFCVLLIREGAIATLARDALIEIRDDAIWILESCVLLIREDAIAILRYTIS